MSESLYQPNNGNLESREYQVEIANKCVNKNSLVVLPTGLGKTIIAVLVAKKTLEIFSDKSKIIILAPTRPLINQHHDTFTKFLDIPHNKFVVLTGKILPEKRAELYAENQIIFFTPQTLRNDLVNRRYTLQEAALIIYDEAHHASGDYPYTMIADEYVEQNPNGVSLALTASPGASKNKIAILCQNLHIPMENIHLRTRKDEDVRNYLKPMDIFKIGVNLTEPMEKVYSVVTAVLEERLQYLSQFNFLEEKSEQLHTKIIRKDLLRLNSELVALLNSDSDKTGVYSALSINAQALILYHMLELIEQQGLDVLLLYLEKFMKDQKKKTSSKAVKVLAVDSRIRRIFIELKKNEELSPQRLVHPKFQVLVQVLQDELRNNPSSRILVFVKLRDSLKTIVKKLKLVENIKPVRFVGQSTKSADDKGLSQKKQIELLDEFKTGIFNVLVSTNVGEEGLDIVECDLVVFYDVVASEIRLIQRKGRTARHRKGRVVILYCKGTHDEKYLRIALNKLNKMNANLRGSEPLTEESPIVRLENDVKSKSKSLHQSNLQNFIEREPILSDIQISKYIPMKFGIRKSLDEEDITFTIKDSDLHIIIFNKVLIQIFHPRRIIEESFLVEIQELREICKLLIIIADFVDFKEEFTGEGRMISNQLRELQTNSQLIPIYTESELLFIIKGVLESTKEI
ncbi:MAG: DEAD/DEAH box helicase family protein [Promethearchaeota archaeon]